MPSLDQQLFKLGFEISPVILVNGVAAQIAGQMLPIVALTQASDFTAGLLSSDGTLPTSLDQYLCHWKPAPGTEFLKMIPGVFPFANQSTAANSLIAEPLNISMLMVAPVQLEGGYQAKFSIMNVLVQTLTQHASLGGTYVIATPAQMFPTCLLTGIRDVSGGASNQSQHTFQFDFVQPLININQATQVYNTLMNKIAAGQVNSLTPSWSGNAAAVGSNVAAGTGGATLFPSASNLVGTSAAGVAAQAGVGGNTAGFGI